MKIQRALGTFCSVLDKVHRPGDIARGRVKKCFLKELLKLRTLRCDYVGVVAVVMSITVPAKKIRTSF